MTDNDTRTDQARTALDQWLEMWNADGDLARHLCADDIRIRFAVTEPGADCHACHESAQSAGMSTPMFSAMSFRDFWSEEFGRLMGQCQARVGISTVPRAADN